MNVDENLIDNNANGQVIAGNADYAYVDIPDLRNSPYIYYNQNNKNYATSLRLRIPRNTQMTPIQIKGVNGYDLTTNDPEPAILTPFGKFEEVGNTPEKVTLNVGDEAILIAPDNTHIAHVSNYHTEAEAYPKAMTLFEGAKYYIFRATEIAGMLGKLACTVYDTYNKITLGMPKWVLPAVLSGVVVTTDNGVQVQEIDIMSAPRLSENYITLPKNTYQIVN